LRVAPELTAATGSQRQYLELTPISVVLQKQTLTWDFRLMICPRVFKDPALLLLSGCPDILSIVVGQRISEAPFGTRHPLFPRTVFDWPTSIEMA